MLQIPVKKFPKMALLVQIQAFLFFHKILQNFSILKILAQAYTKKAFLV